jgi:hypothetical protein
MSGDDCEKMTIEDFVAAVRAGAYADDDGTRVSRDGGR